MTYEYEIVSLGGEGPPYRIRRRRTWGRLHGVWRWVHDGQAWWLRRPLQAGTVAEAEAGMRYDQRRQVGWQAPAAASMDCTSCSEDVGDQEWLMVTLRHGRREKVWQQTATLCRNCLRLQGRWMIVRAPNGWYGCGLVPLPEEPVDKADPAGPGPTELM